MLTRKKRWNNNSKLKQEISTVSQKIVKNYVETHSELKYITYTNSATADYNGAITLMTTIAQADTDTGRNGDRVRVKRLICKGVAYLASSSTTNTGRIVIFRYRSQGTPTVVEVFQSYLSSTAPLTPAPAHDFRKNVLVLYDSGPILLDTYHPNRKYGCDIKLDWPIQYANGSSTVGTDLIWMAKISESAGTANTIPSFTSYSKITYKDF